MPTQDLNVRIAEVLGYYKRCVSDAEESVWVRFVEGSSNTSGGHYTCGPNLPDWAGDLNLMHELIMALNSDEFDRWKIELIKIADCDLLCTTAAQKAEAWVRCKEGKG